jgi:hypothetical protein
MNTFKGTSFGFDDAGGKGEEGFKGTSFGYELAPATGFSGTSFGYQLVHAHLKEQIIKKKITRKWRT